MKAPIMEVFSSIQGEGLLMGRRQIFVRFAGCNLSCNYCDTPESRDASSGERVSVEELHETVKGLITPDFHSLSITGGEPLLYPEFIEEFLDGSPYSALLETNGSLPENARRIAHLFDHASVDIKTPEHFSEDTRGDSTKSDISWSRDIIDREIQVVNILISKGANTYCKVVVMPTTRADYIGNLAKRLREDVDEPEKLSMVIQPCSSPGGWAGNTPRLLEMSQEAGKYMDVYVIPQMHRALGLR
ncbi:7-carboxy-7-deazaguanine synthase QueE [Methanothermobacter wolfeii]|uniref:7-carboxy-7-deazaguanine synthase n=1 Tax=Methanothermobacter wolfeii TaxID=145261 RepID=A0A9E7UGG9_METWO|nr:MULTISPECIES: 7-carboxy-7-deazaguanine synthase QueE [Methanothermobacter]NLM02478.1 7-carboxy-7-deazaguanine synthase QueE [Methanothermobacter wolfeii]QHN06961.1 7-carboxy-7-deazaguanine synthase QueE [Methanothermobacter sp. THM-1]UXH31549.1 7-carboxy-7-deazaguanine synthase QueE [Methanothermobacter wolfeii]SCM58418.1 7-carboxy-7-deazaguanine synthase {ECO:0000255/HAMAP-Rule:MF_00917} [Methanothermobacter wolfeii]